MRATPPPSSSGRHGSTANVVGSGIAIMSDSSIALKPVIEEPSKPIPPSKASSSSAALIENDFSWPRMSVNQSRMKRIPRSSASALTSSAVWASRPSDGGSLDGEPRGAAQLDRAYNARAQPSASGAPRTSARCSAGASSRPISVSSYSTRTGASRRARGARRSRAPRAPSSARTAAGRRARDRLRRSRRSASARPRAGRR